MMMARAFVVAALLAVAVAPCVRAQDYDTGMKIPMNAKGKYAKAVSEREAREHARDADIAGGRRSVRTLFFVCRPSPLHPFPHC